MQLLAILDEKRVEEPTISATVFSVFDSKLSLPDVSRKLHECFKVSNKPRRNLKKLNFVELSTFIEERGTIRGKG